MVQRNVDILTVRWKRQEEICKKKKKHGLLIAEWNITFYRNSIHRYELFID